LGAVAGVQHSFTTRLDMAVNVASEEYSDALQGVSSDPYDVSSWSILLDEVMGGRGGTASVVDTLKKFLKQFPRSGKTWGWLASYYVNNGQPQTAEELLREELPKLRHVELWSQYIKTVKRLIPKDSKDEKYSAARKAYENAFERALENVGYSVESGPIWKDYIDFLKDLPDAGMDPAKKREALRSAYQRALAVPNEQLEELWKTYEVFERYAGEHSAKEILPEVEKKLLSAKAIFRERKRMVAKIIFDRHAVPASASSGQQRQKELEQLDLWNKWIKYEKGNPENLDAAVLGEVLQMVYDQCLCCLRFHPEIWLSLAKFKIKEGGGLKGMAAARTVMNEAISVLPGVALLRVAYSEFEEQWGSPDTARKILDEAFAQLPCGLLFAVKQRFIRRRDGIVAARQFFSDTLPMRLDKKLGYEVRTSCNPFHESARQTMFLSPPPPLSLSLTLCCRCTSPTHSWSSTLTAAQMWLCASWSSLALCTLPKPTHRRLFACSCVCCCGWASWAKFGGPSRSCSARAARRLCGVSRALALAVVVVEVVAP